MTTKLDIVNDYKTIDKDRVLTYIRTSGSTSTPVYIPLNKVDIDILTEVGAKCFQASGLHKGMTVVNTLNSSLWAGGTIDTLSLAKTGATVINFSVGNTKELIQVILDLKVDAISCTPSYLEKIQRELSTSYGLLPNQLNLKLILSAGECGVQNKIFRDSIESLWCCKLVDSNYGLAEVFSLFASEDYELQDGLIFRASDYLEPKLLINNELFEVSNDLIGELTLSTKWKGGLINRVNYRTGDLIHVTKLNTAVKEFNFNIVGRVDEMMVIRGLNVFPTTIFDTFNKVLNEFGRVGIGQIHISKSDPVIDIEFWTDVKDPSIGSMLSNEFKKSTSISIKVKNKKPIYTSTEKLKRVIKDL